MGIDTAIEILALLGVATVIVRGEVSVRRDDRFNAEQVAVRTHLARIELKLERRAEELRTHCTREDLQYLAENGSEFAQRRLKALEPPPKRDPDPVSAYEEKLRAAISRKYGAHREVRFYDPRTGKLQAPITTKMRKHYY